MYLQANQNKNNAFFQTLKQHLLHKKEPKQLTLQLLHIFYLIPIKTIK